MLPEYQKDPSQRSKQEPHGQSSKDVVDVDTEPDEVHIKLVRIRFDHTTMSRATSLITILTAVITVLAVLVAIWILLD